MFSTFVARTFLLLQYIFGFGYLVCHVPRTIAHVFCLQKETHVTLCFSKGWSTHKRVPENDDFGEAEGKQANDYFARTSLVCNLAAFDHNTRTSTINFFLSRP